MAREELVWRPVEPKTQNRFWFYLEPGGVPSHLCVATNKPSFTMSPIIVDHLNVQRKFKGKMEWQDITLTLNDVIDPIAAASVHDWVLAHHDPVTGVDGYAEDYKRELQLDAIGPDLEPVETWILNGAFIIGTNYGDLDFASNEKLTIELTLAYDYAELLF